MVQLGGVLHNVHEKIVEIDSRSIQINDKNGVCTQTPFLHYNIKIFILSFALYYVLHKVHYHR